MLACVFEGKLVNKTAEHWNERDSIIKIKMYNFSHCSCSGIRPAIKSGTYTINPESTRQQEYSTSLLGGNPIHIVTMWLP